MSESLDLKLEIKRSNWDRAFHALKVSAETPVLEPRDLSGIIKDFEIVYELTWRTVKAFLEGEGHPTRSAKDVFTQAYKLGYIDRETDWLAMIDDRNLTMHTYDQELATELCVKIRNDYVELFESLRPYFKLKA